MLNPRSNLLIFLAAGVKCICGGPKSLPVLHHSANYISVSFGINKLIISNIQDLLEGMSSGAFEHAQTKPTKLPVRPAKTQISLGNHPV